MKPLQSIVNWVVFSSKNPKNISLTLKGLIPFLAFFGVDMWMGEANLNTVVESLGNLLTALAMLVTAAISFYGLCRKVYLSITTE